MALGKLRAKSLEKGFSIGSGEDKRVYVDFETDRKPGRFANPNDEGIEQPGRKVRDLYEKNTNRDYPDMPAVPYDNDREWAKRKPLKKPKEL